MRREAGADDAANGQAPDRQAIRRRIEALGPWFHNMEIGGVATAPDHFLGDYPRFKWERFRHLVPEDLSGLDVLDIGCNAGFYSLEMKRRGARSVLGIDSDPRYLAQARLAAEIEGLDIAFREMSVYEVARLGRRFDLVIFMGVLYHLRHPLLALDLLAASVVGDRLLVQSMLRGPDAEAPAPCDHAFDDRASLETPGFPRLAFLEHAFAGDPTNWWVPNRAGMEAILRSAGFRIEAGPADEVYLCRRSDRPADREAALDTLLRG